MDPEGLSYTTKILNNLPTYATLTNSDTQLKILPINCLTDFGNKVISIILEDDEPKTLIYSFTIKVPNLPPEF